jgi:hypothetical protein
MLAILPIAHKYCMDRIETSILGRLKKASTTETYVDLMVASKIVDSQPLYQQALQGLISSKSKPNLLQARRIGIEAHHAIMEAALSMAASSATATISNLEDAVTASSSKLTAAEAELAILNSTKCRHCSETILECTERPDTPPFSWNPRK